MICEIYTTIFFYYCLYTYIYVENIIFKLVSCALLIIQWFWIKLLRVLEVNEYSLHRKIRHRAEYWPWILKRSIRTWLVYEGSFYVASMNGYVSVARDGNNYYSRIHLFDYFINIHNKSGSKLINFQVLMLKDTYWTSNYKFSNPQRIRNITIL